jgi:hypothetical protein
VHVPQARMIAYRAYQAGGTNLFCMRLQNRKWEGLVRSCEMLTISSHGHSETSETSDGKPNTGVQFFLAGECHECRCCHQLGCTLTFRRPAREHSQTRAISVDEISP